MTYLAPTVTIYFDLPSQGGEFFTLDDDTRGELNNTTYVLAGDVGTDVSAYVTAMTIQRGRKDLLEDIPTGVATIQFNNHDRRFDPFNVAGPYYGKLTPRRKVTVAVGGVLIFVGRVEDWDNDWGVDLDAVATVTVLDNLGSLALMSFTEWTTTDAQLTGARLTSILDRSEVAFPGGARALDTGVSTLQDDLVTWGSNVLNYCQLVTRSDLGALFDSREGVLTFRDRHANLNDDPTIIFTDATEVLDDVLTDENGEWLTDEDGEYLYIGDATTDGLVPFHAVTTRSTLDLLYTSVSVDAEGFTKQTSTDTDAVEEYGPSRLAVAGLLLDSEAQASDMADYLLGLYSEPLPRVGSVTVKVHSGDVDAVARAALCSTDLTTLARVYWTPRSTGDPVDRHQIIEGITHRFSPAEHEITFDFSDANRVAAFTLDSSEFGVLDVSVLTF